MAQSMVYSDSSFFSEILDTGMKLELGQKSEA